MSGESGVAKRVVNLLGSIIDSQECSEREEKVGVINVKWEFTWSFPQASYIIRMHVAVIELRIFQLFNELRRYLQVIYLGIQTDCFGLNVVFKWELFQGMVRFIVVVLFSKQMGPS